MTTSGELALKRTFDNEDRLRRRHAEGATVYSIPAAVFVVRDEFISTVCSGCLKTKHPQNTLRLQQCSKCKFVRYCSRECQTFDWKKFHKDECGLMKAVGKSCLHQDTSFARLFVRNALKSNNDLNDPSCTSSNQSTMCPCCLVENVEQCLRLFPQPQNCRTLFVTWQPILEALNRLHSSDMHQFRSFMHALTEVAGLSLPMFGSGHHYSQEPIAYCTYLYKTMYNAVCKPNAVFVPAIDAVHGPILQVKALKPLESGQMVLCAQASNLLISPINLRSQGAIVLGSDAHVEEGTLFIGSRAEILCPKCGDEVDIGMPKGGSLGALESVRFLHLSCPQCGAESTSHRISDLLILKLTKLTCRKLPYSQQSENQLMVKIDELKDLISTLCPQVSSGNAGGHYLTEGALQAILDGVIVDRPTLQLLTARERMDKNFAVGKRYWLLLSDGRNSYNMVIEGMQLNSRFDAHKFSNFSVVTLDKYVCGEQGPPHGPKKKVLIVLEMSVVAAGDQVKTKIGDPTLIGENASVAGGKNKSKAQRQPPQPAINGGRSMVGSTSFALGILYKELADVHETLGRMDKCVEAYKMMIPIVEKHLQKYDQNIFDGLSRVIVYHLERQEITESLPYIEKTWERLQKIPGKESFDFHVVDKLRKAVWSNTADFSFSKFCSVEPT